MIELRTTRRLVGFVIFGAILISLGSPLLIRGVRKLAITRQAVASYSRLITSGNAQDLASVRSLCTERYLMRHRLEIAREGGVVGFPRQIHPNYQVWVEGSEVWLCSGNRMGQVVRFVSEAGIWKFDGPAGILRSNGEVIPASTEPTETPGKP